MASCARLRLLGLLSSFVCGRFSPDSAHLAVTPGLHPAATPPVPAPSAQSARTLQAPCAPCALLYPWQVTIMRQTAAKLHCCPARVSPNHSCVHPTKVPPNSPHCKVWKWLQYEEQLAISDALNAKLQADFAQQLRAGLQKDKEASSLLMAPSFLWNLPNGTETGSVLALDLGGTSFRVMHVVLGQSPSEVVCPHNLSVAVCYAVCDTCSKAAGNPGSVCGCTSVLVAVALLHGIVSDERVTSGVWECIYSRPSSRHPRSHAYRFRIMRIFRPLTSPCR